jgi:hypothetical protein
MLRHSLYFFVLLLSAPWLVAKEKPTFPKLVVNARYVLVTTYFGDDPSNVRIMSEDRQAVADVQNAIQKWGRYTLVYERKNADLIILVRKGRIAGARAGITIHTGSEKPSPSVASGINADAGDSQDMLAVYDAAQGIDNPPLWRARDAEGLKPPEMRLVDELRTKVEAAAKKP